MTRSMQHRCFQIADLDYILILNALVNLDWTGRPHSDPGSLNIDHLQQRVIVLVQQDRSAGCGAQLHRSAYVVDVGVRDDDLLDGKFVPAYCLQDMLDVVTGIDDDALVDLLVTNYGAVTPEDADRKDLMDHRWSALWNLARNWLWLLI